MRAGKSWTSKCAQFCVKERECYEAMGTTQRSEENHMASERENIPWALRTTKSTLLSTELKPQERSGVSQQEESQRTAGAWDFSRIHQPRDWREWQE